MKNIITLLFAALSIASYSQDTTQSKSYLAKPKAINGVYVFAHSLPVDSFYTLGWVSKIDNWTGTYSEFINGIIKRAKRKYPSCNGIIMGLGGDYTLESTVEVIRFMK